MSKDKGEEEEGEVKKYKENINKIHLIINLI